MVGFLIPIPSKVVENVYSGGSNLVKSYQKEPLPKDLSANPGEDDKVPPPAPAPRRSTTNNWASRSTAAPPPRAGGPARAAAPARPAGATNMETFGPQLLAHVLDSINLLESIGQITPDAARGAAAALDGSADAGYAVPPASPARASRAPPAAPRAPAEIRATALWEYGQGGDDDDLAFMEGDTVIIDEEVNDEWLRGRTIPKGRTAPLPKSGLFPSNYVQRL